MAKWQLTFFDDYADLRADGGPPDAVAQVFGRTTAGDIGRGFFKYDSTNASVDDNLNIVRPTGFSAGAWVRYTPAISPLVFYNASGLITPPTKAWASNSVTPSTGDGYSIDISSAGFSSITSINVEVIKSTSVANAAPILSIKSASTTTIVVNIVEGNSATVSILGINVLSGSPHVFADVTGLTLSVRVEGN